MKNIQTLVFNKIQLLGSLKQDGNSKVWEGNLSSVSGSHPSASVFIHLVGETGGDTWQELPQAQAV